ncbi:hypothetical protein SAMN04487957_10565 [Halomonas shengliensis]|uniref:Uncharacterized protein n=1 Tax=Halomonas shengliensis TaxID=419597 RepID=A0A1H0ICB2_9GAMM|nr:hypothetical protein [Halomonas shengliensis]SDO29038.1 hypothetical protein SAMN04487957_10565 [Halomonas shengliensis]
MTPVTEATIDQVFDALGQLYGVHWRRRCADAGWGEEVEGQWVCLDASGEWLRALQHLSEAHVTCGLAALNQAAGEAVAQGRTAWPPDSPMLFAKACRLRPEPLGLPSSEEAWRNVQAHAFTGQPFIHDAVAAAAEHVDLHNLRSASYHQLGEHRRQFQHYYASDNRDCVVERVARGASMRPRAALEHDAKRRQAELAERAGRDVAQRQAEADGLPHAMTADQGLRSLRAALKGA